MQITIKTSVITTRIFLFQSVYHYSYFVFQDNLHSIFNVITIQLRHPSEFQLYSYAKIDWYYISPVKLLDHICSHCSARIARLFSFTTILQRFTLPLTFSTSKYLLAYSDRQIVRFGVTPLATIFATKRSSDLHGRSSCYVHPFHCVPFSCTCLLYSLRIYFPSPFRLPLHCLVFVSLLLIGSRTRCMSQERKTQNPL